MRRKNNVLFILLSVILSCTLLGLLWKAELDNTEREKYYEQLNKKERQIRKEEEKKYALVLLDGTSDACEGIPGKVMLNSDESVKNIEEQTFSFTKIAISMQIECNESDQLILYFRASSQGRSCQLDIRAYSDDARVFQTKCFIQSQKTDYYCYISGVTRLSKVEFSIPERIGGTIECLQIVNAGEEEVHSKFYGGYVECDTEVVSYAEGLSLSDIQDMVCTEQYLFAGSINSLYICGLEDEENPEVISRLDGFGAIRRMELSRDGNLLTIASREYGVFLVDVSNPENPRITSHIDTLELASGIDIVENYLFIASRYYGLEIYNIEDIDNPVFCSAIKSNEESECIDCVVYGNYLYASVWATQRVEIFNVEDLSKPRYIGYIETDGNAYGIDVCNDNLVVATGFHSRINASENIWDSGYATGNGISIYSLEDPTRPVLCSEAKADGRYYYTGCDFWNVKVSGNYAYFADLHNGCYIYDLSNPYDPVRIQKYIVPIPNISEKFVNFSNKDAVFSFDPEAEVYSPISAVAVRDGYMYFADQYSAIHSIAREEAKLALDERTVSAASGEYCYEGNAYSSSKFEVKQLSLEGQAYAIGEYADKIYIETSYGIQICDKDLNKLAFVDTDYAVRDLQIVNGMVYTAQEIGGVHVYEIEELRLIEVGSIVPKENNRINTCYQIGVSPDGRYIVTTGRLNMMMLLDASDLDNITVAEYLKSGAVYYRNIADGYVNDRIYITHPAGVSELTFHENGKYTYEEIPNASYFFSSAGFAAYDDYTLLAVCKKGIQVLDVTNGFENVQEGTFKMFDSLLLKGSPSINRNNKLMCISFPAKGQITLLDTSNLNNIQLLGNFNVQGNADNAYISDDGTFYVPCRYEGVMEITRKN